MLDRDFSSTGSELSVNLVEAMLHLKYNELLKNVPGMWNM